MSRAAADRGFTLLEVLVALAILAVALAAGLRALSSSTLSAEGLRERMLADWVAQNRLAELRASGEFPDFGVLEGEAEQAGRRYRWHQHTQPTPNALFRRIDLQVSDRDGQPLASLSGYAVRPLR